LQSIFDRFLLVYIHDLIDVAVEMGRRILICLFCFLLLQFSFSVVLIIFFLFPTGDADSQCGSVIFLFLLFGGGGAVLKYKNLCV
jgi:hypothetical protein